MTGRADARWTGIFAVALGAAAAAGDPLAALGARAVAAEVPRAARIPEGLFPGDAAIELRLGGAPLALDLPRKLELASGERREFRLGRGVRLAFRRGPEAPTARPPEGPEAEALLVSVLNLSPPEAGDLEVSIDASLPGFERARPARFSRRGGDDAFLLAYAARGGGGGGLGDILARGRSSIAAARGFYDPAADLGADLGAIDPALAFEVALAGAAGATPPAGAGASGGGLPVRVRGKVPRGRETAVFYFRLVPRALGRGAETVPVERPAAAAPRVPPAALGGWILPGGPGVEGEARRLLERAKLPGEAYVELGDGWQGKPASSLFARPARSWLAALREEEAPGEAAQDAGPGAAPGGRRVAGRIARLRALGVSVGLWIVPHGQGDDALFRERPRAFVRDRDGRPVPDRVLGPYVVDGTSEEGLAYLRELARELAATGAGAVRLGGLSAALAFYRRAEGELSIPGKDPLEVLRSTIRAMREGASGPLVLAGDRDAPPEVAGELDAAVPASPPDPGVDPLWLEGAAAAGELRRHLSPSWVELLPVRAGELGRRDEAGGLAFREARSRIALAAVTGRRLLLEGALDIPPELEGLFRRARLPGVACPVDLVRFEEPPRVWALDLGGELGGLLAAAINFDPLRSATAVFRFDAVGLRAEEAGSAGGGAGRCLVMDLERGTIAALSSGPLDLVLLPGDARILSIVPAGGKPRILGVAGDLRATARALSEAVWDPAERTLRSRIEVDPAAGEATVRLHAGERHRFTGAEVRGGSYEAAERDGDIVVRVRGGGGEEDAPADAAGGRASRSLDPGLDGLRALEVSFRFAEVPTGAPGAVPLAPPRDLAVRLEPSERRPLLTWSAGEDSPRWWGAVSGFAVFRDGAEVGRTADVAFLDRSAPRRGAFSYGVAALPAAPLGAGEAPPTSAPVEFRAPEASDAFLDEWTVLGDLGRGARPALRRSAAGGPLSVGGERFARGLGVRAPSRVEYRLDGAYARFEARVGVDDAARFQGAVVFAVEADGAERFRTDAIRGGGGPPARIRADVSGAERLALVVEDASGGAEPALADWCAARLVALATFPLARAHAHNDYRHARPLLDALEHGFSSVEADVFLVEGKLLVGHDRGELRPERTLEALYLDPLLERVRRNGGSVHPGGGEFILLLDAKADGEAVYRALQALLPEYAEMLTVFRADAIERRAVTAILSGDRPRAAVEADAERLVALDGRLPDLESDAPASLVPLVSQDWASAFAWRGSGRMPEAQRRELRRLVEAAHARGRKLRFWGTPHAPSLWDELFDAGVDLLNADDLEGLEDFLRERLREGSPP